MMRNWFLAGVLVAATAFCANAFAGGKVLADQGNNYAADGQQWPLTLNTTLVGSIPFALDFGSGPVSNRAFFVNPHGEVQFTSDPNNTASQTGDYIDLLYNKTTGFNGQFVPGAVISNEQGLIDPSLVDPSIAPDFSDTSHGLTAYRFLFNGVCPGNDQSCNSLQFEAVFVFLTSESFVLQLNYGDSNSFDAKDPFTEFQTGVHLGSNVFSPLDTNGIAVGPDFCFANGVATTFRSLATCRVGIAAVPEPDVASLFLGGLVLAIYGGAARRRSRRSAVA